MRRKNILALESSKQVKLNGLHPEGRIAVQQREDFCYESFRPIRNFYERRL